MFSCSNPDGEITLTLTLTLAHQHAKTPTSRHPFTLYLDHNLVFLTFVPNSPGGHLGAEGRGT